VYAAEIDGQRLTFHAEAVWRRNMIIRDEETGTLWQHATGEALAGPHKGKFLPIIGGERITWTAWRKRYPHTLVPAGPEKWPGLLPLALTERVLEKATQSGKVPGLTPTDKRLSPNEDVVGISINDEHRAYPLAILESELIIHDKLSQKPLTLTFEPETKRIIATSGGQPIAFNRGWWSAWHEFHPGTTIYTGK
jgi:hypothetical protein